MAFTNQQGRTQTSLSEINVTPLVDVMLVLLVIFMVTAPILQTGIDVNLPKTRESRTEQPKPRAVVISIGSLFTVAEYQNGRAGASGAGRSFRDTLNAARPSIDNAVWPSISLRICPNSVQPISSSVCPLTVSRSVLSQREPNFVADSTAAPKVIERVDTNADRSAVPIT